MAPATVSESGKILAECKALLAELRMQYSDDPHGEYRRLAMLALEREQLVSYAYRDDILGRRLSTLVAPPDVIAVMRHAFTQVWRDEEAHTVMIRGTLLTEAPSAVDVARTSVEQTAGWLAGWSSALKHHVPRSSAPFRSVLVDGLAGAARIVGKLSPDLRAELQRKSFREFCEYNIDAEETAELCWERLVELEDELGATNSKTFRRIAREEREHREVFALVAEVLDAHDWVRPGTTADGLAAQLASIGCRFAPAKYRQTSRSPSRGFGSGAPVYVFDAVNVTRSAAAADALRLLGEVAGESVVIQASWMMGYSTDDPSTIVDPELLQLIVEQLQRAGATVTVIDGPNLYSDLYANRTVSSVAEHFKLVPGCPVADGTAEVADLGAEPIMGPSGVSRLWVEADHRISLVRLRSHPRELIHGCTANLESLVPGASMNVFWQRRYDYSAAALAAAIVAPPHLAILDAWRDCPDGLFGIMAGRNVCHPGRLYASTDALACDLIALRDTGSARAIESPTLRRAIEWFGDPRPRIVVHGADSPIDEWRHPHDTFVSGILADLSYPVFAYLSGSGALFAPPMDGAFPERTRPAAPARLIRAIARRLLGLRPPP